MKTTDEIMRRKWDHPSHPYRAIDKDGEDLYYEHKPSNNDYLWITSDGDFTEAEAGIEGWIDADWASENWVNSLQSFEEYQTLTGLCADYGHCSAIEMNKKQSKYKFPSPYFPDWVDVDDKYKYRAFDSDGALFYYTYEPEFREYPGIWATEQAAFDKVANASPKWTSKIWRDSLEKRPE
jgi:hypothetical protein